MQRYLKCFVELKSTSYEDAADFCETVFDLWDDGWEEYGYEEDNSGAWFIKEI